MRSARAAATATATANVWPETKGEGPEMERLNVGEAGVEINSDK